MMHHPAPRQTHVLIIERSMVIRQEHDAVVDVLNGLMKDAAAVRANAGTVDLVFHGYDDDHRELYLIGEVRAYVRVLHQRFPYWFHFANLTSEALFVIMACLLEFESSSSAGGVVTSRITPGQLGPLLRQMFRSANSLHTIFGLNAGDTRAMTLRVTEFLGTFLGDPES